MYLWPWLKMSIFFTEISCFWCRNERGRQNVDGRNIQKFHQKSEENKRNISLYFGLFRQFFEKIDALHLY